MRLPIVVAAAMLLVIGSAHADEETVVLAGLKVTIWSQPSSENLKQPVIIFSHGFHGCATQSRLLMEAFASAGPLAVIALG
jgi:hypothetical protein